MMVLLRRWFLAGLLVWAPLGVTLLLLRFLVSLLNSSLLLVPEAYQPKWFGIPGIGVILTLLLLLSTGALTANFIGREVLAWAETWLHRVPLVGSVYGGMKKLAETVFSGSGNAFRKVVLVEYPRRDSWTVGFLTADPPAGLVAEVDEKQWVSVFIPTTPNPTSGFLILVPRAEVRELPVSVEQGMQYIISLGVVAPGSH